MYTFDQASLYILILIPLIASIFISLIPSFDIESKNTLSCFFAVAGFCVFIRIFYLFGIGSKLKNISFSFSLLNFKIKFLLFLNEYNIYFFGIISLILLLYNFLFEISDTKSNIHHVSPFLLAFIANICFGQKDLRIALPLLSISTFMIYFLIGHSDRQRKGSAIFHMGTYLFGIDALALVILQLQSFKEYIFFILIALGILAPGLARLCLPAFSPFLQRLILNVDRREGPFIFAFLQLVGLYILVLAKNEIGKNLLSADIPLMMAALGMLSSLNVALISITNFKSEVLPYYSLCFYSSLIPSVLFASSEKLFFYLTISLYLTNIIIFFNTTKTHNLIYYFGSPYEKKSDLRAMWFLCLSPFLGVPGIGIGVSLWPALYTMATQFAHDAHPKKILWIAFLSLWFLAFILLAVALVLTIRAEFFQRSNMTREISEAFKKKIKSFFILSPIAAVILSWLIPFAIFWPHKS